MHTQQLPVHNPGGLGVFALMAQALMAPYSHPGREDGASADSPTPAPEIAPRRGLFDRLERWLWAQHQRDLEAYLAKASDLHDLERRMRYIERNAMHPFH